MAVKTTAPPNVVWDVMRAYHKKKSAEINNNVVVNVENNTSESVGRNGGPKQQKHKQGNKRPDKKNGDEAVTKDHEGSDENKIHSGISRDASRVDVSTLILAHPSSINVDFTVPQVC